MTEGFRHQFSPVLSHRNKRSGMSTSVMGILLQAAPNVPIEVQLPGLKFIFKQPIESQSPSSASIGNYAKV